MKAIRVMALGALILIASAITASAQGMGGQQGQAGGRRPDRLLDNMMLTDAQKVRIESITKKYQPDMQAIYLAMNSGDRIDARQKMVALREKMQPEVRAVLTPDQQAIFDKNAAEQKSRMYQLTRQM